ncbi:MAG: hypothetical protein AB7P37_06910 [Ramlibacter sp.]
MAALPALKAPAAVAQLTTLLAQHGDAILHGRADELPALHQAIQAGLRQLVASGWRIRSRDDRLWLQNLLQTTEASQTMLARRQLAIQQSLDALGAGSAALKEVQAQRLYASAGRMGAPVLRGQGYVSA